MIFFFVRRSAELELVRGVWWFMCFGFGKYINVFLYY